MAKLDDFISGTEIPQPDLTELEIFHESTKLYPATVPKMSERVMFYLTNRTAFREMARNLKPYRRAQRVELPAPAPIAVPYSQVVQRRRSPSRFRRMPFGLQQLSDLLAATARINDSSPHPLDNEVTLHRRPYPSAGGLYPVEIYPLLLNVDGVAPHVAHYDPVGHGLQLLRPLGPASLKGVFFPDDQHLDTASLYLLFTSAWGRSTVKYAQRGYRFAMLEAGAVSMMATLAALGVGMEVLHWGGYFDDAVHDLLEIDGVNESVVHTLIIGSADQYPIKT